MTGIGAKFTDTQKEKTLFDRSLVAPYVMRCFLCFFVGAKMIAAGTVMQSGICLFHVHCAGGMLELSIKSNNRLLNDSVSRHCSVVFT